jgi:hypothetical protein
VGCVQETPSGDKKRGWGGGMKCGGGRSEARAGGGGGSVRFKLISGAFPATYFEKMA